MFNFWSDILLKECNFDRKIGFNINLTINLETKNCFMFVSIPLYCFKFVFCVPDNQNNLIKLCSNFVVEPPEAPQDLCVPYPCGSNTKCLDGKCSCLPEYQGDPYIGCRPECVMNNDCPTQLACIRNKCKDPCPGTCGENAICNVYNHIPICSCPAGMSGNAFIQCRPFESKLLTQIDL